MVEPSVSDDDREAFLLQFRIGFALLVGASMALVALNGAGTAELIVGAGVGGTVVGGVLGWLVFPDRVILGYRDRR